MNEYIRMCSQANEIQDIWQPQRLDKYYLEDNNGDIYTKSIEDTLKNEDYMIEENGVWIPRQEDYQKIISNYQRVEKKIEDWTPWCLLKDYTCIWMSHRLNGIQILILIKFI